MLTLLRDRVIKTCFVIKDRVINGCFVIKDRVIRLIRAIMIKITDSRSQLSDVEKTTFFVKP